MAAGGRPMTAPEAMPKMMQKARACARDVESVQRIRMSKEERAVATMCMFRGPVASPKADMVRRPRVEAPFMRVRSQNVWSGFEVVVLGWMGVVEPARVPKPLTAAHCGGS